MIRRKKPPQEELRRKALEEAEVKPREKGNYLDFFAETCQPLTKAEAGRLIKARQAPKKHPDCQVKVIVVPDLTAEEFQMIRHLCVSTRQSIIMDTAQYLAHMDPISGFKLCRSVAETVRRMLDYDTLEEALYLPREDGEQPYTLGQHPGRAVVEKIYNAVLASFAQKNSSDAGRRKETPKSPNSFRRFWKDGFLLYRNFVFSCARAENVTYKMAITHCGAIGSIYAWTKQTMRVVLKFWDDSFDAVVVSNDGKDDEWVVDEHCDRFEDELKTHKQTYEEWYHAQGFSEDKPKDDDEGANNSKLLWRMMRRVIKNVKEKQKQARPPQTRPAPKLASSKKKRKPKESITIKQPNAKKAKKPEESTTEVGEKDADVEEDPVLVPDLPIFDPTESAEADDEWMIIECPHSSLEMGGKENPTLVRGHIFAPPGSDDLKITLAIKIVPTFIYIMERADIKNHGMEQGKNLDDLRQRCEKQGVLFAKVIPGTQHAFFMMEGVAVVDSSHDIYKDCFGGVHMDPKRVHSYLKESCDGGDVERGAMQATLGISTQNFESEAKTIEELDERILDRPNWSGTVGDFQQLAPLIRDVVDGLTKFVDRIYTKPDRKLHNELRNSLFSERVNQRLGCKCNRLETITASISYLNPRTYSLLRHLDNKNCKLEGYDVTAIWSTVFWDVDTKGNKVLARLSIIGYTRSNAGSFVERCTSYVSTFRTRITQVMNLEHYDKVAEYDKLNLAEQWERGKFEKISVWADSVSDGPSVICLKHPMFFDPSGWLASFAWCITRLREAWALSKSQVVELCYIGSIHSSPLPYVWLTGDLLWETRASSRELLESYKGDIGHLFYAEMGKRARRPSCHGGQIPRHQTSVSHNPGTEKVYTVMGNEEDDVEEDSMGENGEDPQVSMDDFAENEVEQPVPITEVKYTYTYEYTEKSLKEKRQQMEFLGNLVNLVSSRQMTGAQFVEEIQVKRPEAPVFLGELNCLKMLPLMAFVGVFDVGECFDTALSGRIPRKKPHGKELTRLDCKPGNDETKFVEGINEWLGQPREYFFHADHAMCMAQGLRNHPSAKKWDPFFPDMPLLRFAEDQETRKVRVMQKKYGSKEWEWYQPHSWS
jgi:hypothetical protein